MRIRTVKPEFWTHAVMAQLPAEAQLLALALLNMADDHGYFEADPRIIRGAVMPFREDLKSVSRDLQVLSSAGWVELHTTEEHGAVGRIVNWAKHQRVTHPAASKLKVYFDTCEAIQVLTRSDTGPHEEAYRSDTGPHEEVYRERKGKEGEGEQGGTKPKQAKKPKPQSDLPGVVPPPRKPTPAEAYYARFLESRELQLEDLGVPVTPLPEPNWARVGATIKAWQEYAQAQDPGDLKGPDKLCRWLIDDFCEDPYWAGATDQKTGEPQPYPWNALASETVWRKLIAKIDAKLEAMPMPKGAA